MATEPNDITGLEVPLFCCFFFFCSHRLEDLSVMQVEMARGFLSRVWLVVADRFHGRHSDAPSQTSVF